MFDNGFGRVFKAHLIAADDWDWVFKAWVKRNIMVGYQGKALALSEARQRVLVATWEAEGIKDYVDKGLADGSLEKVDIEE